MSNNLSDVTVKLNVEQPSVPVNMGNLAVFVKGDAGKMESFRTYDDIYDEYQSKPSLLKIAEGYFSQGSHGEKLIVITYADLKNEFETYYGAGWEFATVLETDALTPSRLAGYIDGKGERMAIFAYPATAETVDDAEMIKESLGSSPRTIAFVAGENDDEAKFALGALIGAVGNETVGSVTWKFKKIGGVKPVKLNASQIGKLHEANLFTYVTKAGTNQTSEGKTIGGEYIDALHGDDWVKASIETELQKLLSSSNKVSFDAVGIAQIDATVTQVLAQATRNGIILENAETGMGDFNVTTASREESSAADIANRHYTGLQFSYKRSGAIHSVVVSGQISL